MDEEHLQIQLLGTFQLRAGAGPVPGLHAPRLQALLAYLLIHRDAPQPRRRIAFCLWPASTEAQARTNLRNLLHQLRHLLPQAAACLAHEGPALQWRAEGPFRLDVAEFERDLARAEELSRLGQPAAARAALEAAVAAYAGDLLPGCYDEWILPERERLRQRFLAALERLVALLEAQGDYPAAIPFAQRLVLAEPLSEAAYLQLMRLQALSGDRAAALQTYQSCAATLQRELAIEPGLPLREAAAGLHEIPPAVATPPGRPALVGRRSEWRELLALWRAAAAGKPRLLVLSGEAGVGKSRLAEELRAWAERQGAVAALARCYAAEGELAFAPVSAWLRAPALGERLAALEPCWLGELARLLPELRGEQDGGAPPAPLSEPGQRQCLLEALRRALLAAGRPLLLLLDDLQWCDRASLEALHYLLHADAGARLLLLATLRPDELDADGPPAELLAELCARDQATLLELAPLGAAETRELATQLVGRPLSADEGAALYDATEGYPLFVVEMLRARACCGAAGPCAVLGLELPARLRALIARRLARLSPLAQELAGLAALAGHAVSLPLLARASRGLDEETLLRGLDELLRRRILRERPGACYDFSHARLREAAREQLSAARRQVLEQRLAAAREAPHRAGEPLEAQLGAPRARVVADGLRETPRP